MNHRLLLRIITMELLNDTKEKIRKRSITCNDRSITAMFPEILREWQDTLYQMAVVHQALGNYEESLSISYQAMNLYEKEGSGFGMANTFIHLGNLFTPLE